MNPGLPMMLLPCNPTLAGASAFTPSGKPVESPGILKMIQCVMSSSCLRACASGSCKSSTKLCVPAGGFVHDTGIDVMLANPPGPAQVYFSGIDPPSGYAGVESCSGGPGGGPAGLPPPGPPGPPPGGGPCCAKVGTTIAAAKKAKVVNTFTAVFRIPSSPFFASLTM